MIQWAALGSMVSAGALAVTGYLVGARRGLLARDGLRGDVARAESVAGEARAEAERRAFEAERKGSEASQAAALAAQRTHAIAQTQAEVERQRALVTEAAAQASQHRAALEKARAEGAEQRSAVERAQAETARMKALHDRANTEAAHLRQEADGLRAALAQATEALSRAQPAAESFRAPIDEVRRMLAPLIDKARLDQAMADVDAAGTTRGELPRLLDAIANRGSFDAVVLSDDAGLPVAASLRAQDADAVAGAASMLLTMADRVTATGAPEPRAMVVLDAESRTMVHRVLRVRGDRFLLTAVGRGSALGVDVLDPVLSHVERLLEA